MSEGNRLTLARDVLAIVLSGVVLGVAFNVLETSSRPPRGLPWIASTQALESVENWVSSDAAPSGTSVPSVPEGGNVPDSTREAADPSPEAAAPSHAVAPVPPAAEPPTIPDTERPLLVGLTTVAQFVEANAALVVDARDREAFADAHIPGAINIPYDEVTADPARLEKLDSGGRPIIVYCSGGTCESSRMLAEAMMRDFGMRRVLVYEAGLPDWVQAGKPVSRASQ